MDEDCIDSEDVATKYNEAECSIGDAARINHEGIGDLVLAQEEHGN